MKHAEYQIAGKTEGKGRIVPLHRDRRHAASAGSASGGIPGKLAIVSGHTVRWVDCAEIRYCKADSNYTEIHLADGHKIVVSKTLKWTASQLKSERFFCRCHQSYLVNLRYVSRLERQGGWQLALNCGTAVPVARSARTQFSIQCGLQTSKKTTSAPKSNSHWSE